jgi:hypothetical protein
VRAEREPRWARHLEHGVLTYMKKAGRFLAASPPADLRMGACRIANPADS